MTAMNDQGVAVLRGAELRLRVGPGGPARTLLPPAETPGGDISRAAAAVAAASTILSVSLAPIPNRVIPLAAMADKFRIEPITAEQYETLLPMIAAYQRFYEVPTSTGSATGNSSAASSPPARMACCWEPGTAIG